MKLTSRIFTPVLTTLALAGLFQAALAQEPAPPDTRYGLFGWLDHRSEYGAGIFPEPFLTSDSDLEPDEARLDWLHTEAGSRQNDRVKAEVEKSFGLMTLEIEIPYEREKMPGETVQGVGNVDVGARYPFYQFVSAHGLVDSTFGGALEVGIPVNSPVRRNAELVPKIFNDLKVGEHFTLQTVLGHSTLFGGGEEGGAQAFEYGLVFGYTLRHHELPLPGVREFIPMFELNGTTALNQGQGGRNSLLGVAGFRVNLKAIGRVQPRLGVGFVFPVDKNARTDVHWGVTTSLVFQY